jgi:carbonic anhydrase
MDPGEVFVHRNIANIVHASDLSINAVIDYSVVHLKVKHVVLCGHTSCGGAAAALGNTKLGLIDTWLLPLRALRKNNIKTLESMEAKDALLKLVELNVEQGVKTLKENHTILDAIAERGLQVHGIIYDIGKGEIRELDIQEDEETASVRHKAYKVSS